jgi:hypothetical protein
MQAHRATARNQEGFIEVALCSVEVDLEAVELSAGEEAAGHVVLCGHLTEASYGLFEEGTGFGKVAAQQAGAAHGEMVQGDIEKPRRPWRPGHVP